MRVLPLMRRLPDGHTVNFERAPAELHLELDPHPGGWGYLMLATFCMVCAGLRDIAAPQIASA